ncbi:hypothetical protein G3N95_03810 [Paraburkholderia sp. Tr-20389]|uniref:hypothetical protein n=1 Tax=Paraburkholderia sp. Tr-20389 TaxID=2703903 RepID=UPI00197F3867|nr:hypothetical protein [Paraburkholderia sp. Tr-20389]MBN3752053.1 hypothetical protein [Paraburkholderia sp. Tr-20389]
MDVSSASRNTHWAAQQDDNEQDRSGADDNHPRADAAPASRDQDRHNEPNEGAAQHGDPASAPVMQKQQTSNASARARPSRSTLSQISDGSPLTAQPAGASTVSSGTPVANANIPPTEPQHLLDRYEDVNDHPTDTDNANSEGALQADRMRGMPEDEVLFVKQINLINQQIDALPPTARARYRERLNDAIREYGETTSPEARQKIATALQDNVQKPVNAAYQKIMGDPAQRMQLEFTPPYGTGLLGAAGQNQADQLRRLGQQFNEAKTPGQREALFKQAASLRHQMQRDVQTAIANEQKTLTEQWAQADRELDQALSDAAGIAPTTVQ